MGAFRLSSMKVSCVALKAGAHRPKPMASDSIASVDGDEPTMVRMMPCAAE